jgi:hypothetical protein
MVVILPSRCLFLLSTLPQLAVSGWAGGKALVYYMWSSIVVLFFVVIAATIALFLLLGALKVVGKSAAHRHTRRRDARARLASGAPADLPTGRGMCDGCARAFEEVYYLPSGKRLCLNCYRAYRSTGGNAAGHPPARG